MDGYEVGWGIMMAYAFCFYFNTSSILETHPLTFDPDVLEPDPAQNKWNICRSQLYNYMNTG